MKQVEEELEVMRVICYAVREGYEIKTWLYGVPKHLSDTELEQLARAEFKRVGVELEEKETLEFEQF
jgi:hypothetical protein